MSRYYEGRSIREVRDLKEEFEAEKMGVYYVGDFYDVSQTIDLDQVVEYNEGKANNSGIYDGNPVTHIYLKFTGHCCLLVDYKEFDKAFKEYVKTKK